MNVPLHRPGGPPREIATLRTLAELDRAAAQIDRLTYALYALVGLGVFGMIALFTL
jgi:hypothetical protein